jgi:hypothetical protein
VGLIFLCYLLSIIRVNISLLFAVHYQSEYFQESSTVKDIAEDKSYALKDVIPLHFLIMSSLFL